ncbi:MAG: iron-regulated protein A precursor [Gammaproteobacteria bacterium]|nr:iron-regulated protein A precursor [Gammaproteobacteria bacterium]
MNLIQSSFLLSIAASALSLGACSGSAPAGNNNLYYDANPVISNLADNVIVASYQELNTEAALLKTAITALNGSDDLSSGALISAQNAWKATRGPWERSEGFLIGPVDSLGIDPKLDSWPLNTVDLATAVNSGFSSNASEDVQGFHTIEYLLFGDGILSNTRSTELSPNELTYLQDLLTNFTSHTQTLVDAWTIQYNPSDVNSGPYVNELKLTGDGLYLSQLAVMEELINGMIGIVDEVGNGKIADPFAADINSADTTLVESQYSWNSLTDFHNNIQSVLNVYSGKKSYNPAVDSISDSLNGLYAFVQAHDSQLADRVLNEIIDAMQKIALIDGDADVTSTDISNPLTQIPFRDAINDPAGRVRISTAINALGVLQSSLQNEVISLLSVTDFNN